MRDFLLPVLFWCQDSKQFIGTRLVKPASIWQEVLEEHGLLKALGTLENNDPDADKDEDSDDNDDDEEELTAAFAKAGIN